MHYPLPTGFLRIVILPFPLVGADALLVMDSPLIVLACSRPHSCWLLGSDVSSAGISKDGVASKADSGVEGDNGGSKYGGAVVAGEVERACG